MTNETCSRCLIKGQFIWGSIKDPTINFNIPNIYHTLISFMFYVLKVLYKRVFGQVTRQVWWTRDVTHWQWERTHLVTAAVTWPRTRVPPIRNTVLSSVSVSVPTITWQPAVLVRWELKLPTPDQGFSQKTFMLITRFDLLLGRALSWNLDRLKTFNVNTFWLSSKLSSNWH